MKSETESIRLETSREDMQLKRTIKALRVSRKELEGLCLNTFV